MLEDSASRLWCRVARLSHVVVAIDVANAAAVMRRKFEMLVAAGMRCGGMPSSWSVMTATKKKAMATPCTTIGQHEVAKGGLRIELRAQVDAKRPARRRQRWRTSAHRTG